MDTGVMADYGLTQSLVRRTQETQEASRRQPDIPDHDPDWERLQAIYRRHQAQAAAEEEAGSQRGLTTREDPEQKQVPGSEAAEASESFTEAAHVETTSIDVKPLVNEQVPISSPGASSDYAVQEDPAPHAADIAEPE